MLTGLRWPEWIDNRYEKVAGAELGRGGMGEVWKYYDHRAKRNVAIKQLRQDLRNVRLATERFWQEATTLTDLEDPGIVAAYDLVETQDAMYLVTELIAGTDLSRLVGGSAKLRIAESEAERIVGDVAQALTFAHRRDVVHRDLKPSNILIRQDGVVKVVDFGIAKLVDDLRPPGAGTGPLSMWAQGADDVFVSGNGDTESMGFLGTLGYAAPEQYRVGEPITKATDVFSLGVVLFECIFGVRPFTGANSAEIRASTCEGQAAWPANQAELCSNRNAALITACLQKSPADRLWRGQPLSASLISKLLKGDEAAKSWVRACRSLDQPATAFIGRQAELGDVVNLLRNAATPDDRCPLVTLIGETGVGKSRLACMSVGKFEQFTAQRASTYPRPLVVIALDLTQSPTTAEALDRIVAEAVALDGKATTLRAADAMHTRLLEDRLLLVLDQRATQPPGLRELVGELLEVGNNIGAERADAHPTEAWEAPLAILCAARTALRVPGEQLLRVRPLSLPKLHLPADREAMLRAAGKSQAVQLFLARAKLVRRGLELDESNAGPIVAICQQLEGSPLAIEWAASLMDTRHVQHVLDEVSRLGASDSGGDGEFAAGPADELQSRLDRLLGLSFSRLEPAAQRLLTRLSVLDGPFSIETAVRVAEHPASMVDQLGQLVASSMVTLDASEHDPVYRVDYLPRQYARARGDAAELASARQRLMLFAMEIAERAAELMRKSVQEAHQLVEPVLSHVREAWRLGNAAQVLPTTIGSDVQQLPLLEVKARIAMGMHRYFYQFGPRVEGMAWASAAAQEREHALGKPDKLVGELYRAAGVIAHGSADWRASEKYASRALKIFLAHDDELLIAATQNNLGAALASLHQFEESRSYHKKAFELYSNNKHEMGMASVLLNRSACENLAEQWQEGLDLSTQALQRLKTLKDDHRAAVAMHNRGVAMLKLDRIEQSLDELRACLDARLALRDEQGALWTLVFIASACALAGPGLITAAKLHGYITRRCARRRYTLDRPMLAELASVEQMLRQRLGREEHALFSKLWRADHAVLEVRPELVF